MQILVHVYCVLFLLALICIRDFKSVTQSLVVKFLLFLWLLILCIEILIAAENVEVHPMLYFLSCTCISVLLPSAYFFIRKSYRNIVVSAQDIIHALPLIILFLGLPLLTFLGGDYSVSLRMFYIVFGYTVSLFYIVPLFMLIKEQTIVLLHQNISLATDIILPAKKIVAKEIAPEVKQVRANDAQQSFQFSASQVEQMKIAIESAMKSGTPYLRQKFTITDLSERTEIHLHHLSAFINNHYGMHFNDYINMHRIQYCKRKMIEEQEWRYFTLEAIAKGSGFGNRNTFTAAFKKFNGSTPAEFLKSIKIKRATAA